MTMTHAEIETARAEIADFIATGKPLPALTQQQLRMLDASKRVDDLAAIERLEKKLGR